MTCFDASFLQIDYDERGFLHALWRGYLTVEQVKQGCEELTRLLTRQQSGAVLNDNRLVLGTWVQAVRWVSHDLLPRARRAGLERVAFVYSPASGARYAVNRLLEENEQFLAQSFDDYAEAEAWLLGQPWRPTARQSLLLRVGPRQYVLRCEEINFVCADGDQARVDTDKRQYVVNQSLSTLFAQLDPLAFVRIHRGYVVNRSLISHLTYHADGRYFLFLKSHPGVRMPVSRSLAPGLKRRLELGS